MRRTESIKGDEEANTLLKKLPAPYVVPEKV